jgi:hypothetical protein
MVWMRRQGRQNLGHPCLNVPENFLPGGQTDIAQLVTGGLDIGGSDAMWLMHDANAIYGGHIVDLENAISKQLTINQQSWPTMWSNCM